MGATNVGVRRAHPYLWSLSSPQQPLETEDSPTVSSCPTIYIATRVPCKALFIENYEVSEFIVVACSGLKSSAKLMKLPTKRSSNYFKLKRKIFTTATVLNPYCFLNHACQQGCLLFYLLLFLALDHYSCQRLRSGITQ